MRDLTRWRMSPVSRQRSTAHATMRNKFGQTLKTTNAAFSRMIAMVADESVRSRVPQILSFYLDFQASVASKPLCAVIVPSLSIPRLLILHFLSKI